MSIDSVRVLIAEGEEDVRTALSHALLDRDVLCDCVASGGEAISRLGLSAYGVVLLDYALPNAGAVAVLECLRMLPIAQRPIVLGTAANGDGAGDDSSLSLLAAGSDTDLVQMVLRRPFRIRDVAGMVGACVAQLRTS